MKHASSIKVSPNRIIRKTLQPQIKESLTNNFGISMYMNPIQKCISKTQTHAFTRHPRISSSCIIHHRTCDRETEREGEIRYLQLRWKVPVNVINLILKTSAQHFIRFILMSSRSRKCNKNHTNVNELVEQCNTRGQHLYQKPPGIIKHTSN